MIKIAAKRTKPALSTTPLANAGFKTLYFPLVSAGGLGLYSQATALGGSADLFAQRLPELRSMWRAILIGRAGGQDVALTFVQNNDIIPHTYDLCK